MNPLDTPGKRLRAARKKLNLSMEALGEPLDVSRASISYWEAGKSDIPKASALALEMVHGVSSVWLLTGEGAMWVESARRPPANAVSIPIIEGMPSCGPGGEIQDPGPNSNHYPFSQSFIQEILRQCGAGDVANLFLAQVVGDSMKPTIQSGDLVLVNNDLGLRTQPKKSSLYMVRRNPHTEEARVKRVFFSPGASTLTLQSDNPAYELIVVSIDGQRLQDLILGQVCWYGRRLHDVLPPAEDW